jgi:tRNA-Thr(GGU) m(6)t(6)A37 methyltransferase TsaA
MEQLSFSIMPVGVIHRTDHGIQVEILPAFRPAMKQLDHFSHVMVFWWADRHDNPQSRDILQCEPPYASGKITGVFACRAEYRPNPIAMTVCEILSIDEEQGFLRVRDIDAFDGTPVIDLKAYFPVCDRVQAAHIPEWLSDWPEWLPEEGMGLS